MDEQRLKELHDRSGKTYPRDFENQTATCPAPSSYSQAQTLGGVMAGTPAYTLAEQAEKNFRYHNDEAGKHGQASVFLTKHPEFDEFVRLVRSGAIQF